MLRRRRHRPAGEHGRKETSEKEKVIDAAALQDRLTRSMKLGLGRRQPRAVVVLGTGSGCSRSGSGSGRVGGGRPRRRWIGGTSTPGGHPEDEDASSHMPRAVAQNVGASAAWTCRVCSAENHTHSSGSSRWSGRGALEPVACSVCAQPLLSVRLPEGHGVGEDGGRGGDGFPESLGQHRRQRRVSVTLAQIRGLEEPPEPTLTPGEWRCEAMQPCNPIGW